MRTGHCAYKGAGWSLNTTVNHIFSPLAQRSQMVKPSKSQNSSHWLVFKQSLSESTSILSRWQHHCTRIQLCASLLHPAQASGSLVSWAEPIPTLGFGKLLPLGAAHQLVTPEAARHSCGHTGTSQGKSPMPHGQRFLLCPLLHRRWPPTSQPRPLAPSTQPQSLDAGKQRCHSNTLASPQGLTAPDGQSLLRMFQILGCLFVFGGILG